MSSFPEAKPKSDEYAYVDPKNAHYGVARLGERYHPLDVFEKFDGLEGTSKLGDYLFVPFWGIAIGCSVVVLEQYVHKRPIFSQLHKYAFMSAFGWGFGHFMYSYSRKSAARRDAIVKDYLRQNYEDFPVVERHKIKDLFLKWTPIR